MIRTALAQRVSSTVLAPTELALTMLAPAMLALTFAIGTVPAAAQTTGMVRGTVVDAESQPVEGAEVVIELKDMAGRALTTKSNARGEFVQIGLQPGAYVVTASKEGVGSQTHEVSVQLGGAAEVDFQLTGDSGGETPPSPEALKKAEEAQTRFKEGVQASQAGDDDEAIQKFAEAAELLPTCYECHYNIGLAHARNQRPDEAEAAFTQALETDPEQAGAYEQLADLYGAQERFDEAAEMSAKAEALGGGGGGGAGAGLFDQGVNLWNAGKIDEAVKMFEQVTKVNPNHAAAHYQLGLGYLNQGHMDQAAASFEKYLEVEPDGERSEEVKSLLATLK